MISQTILLDAGGAFLLFIPVAFIIHLVITVFAESAILYLFKYGTYKKCTGAVLLANFISLIFGLGLMVFFASITLHLIVTLLLFYLVTILIEGLIIKATHKTYPIKKLVPAVLLMNLLTYVPIYLILKFID